MTSFAAQDLPQSFTLDGRLYKDTASSEPLLDDTIVLQLQIISPDQECVLYEEEQTVSTTNTKGYFAVRIGSDPMSIKRSGLDSNNTMIKVYSNAAGNITGKHVSTSATCTYTPQSGGSRFLRVLVTPSVDHVTRILQPTMAIDPVPLALIADRAETLQGFPPESFLSVNNQDGKVLNQTNLENIFSSTNYNRLTSLLQNNSLITSIQTGTGLVGGEITGAGKTISIDVGTSANKIVQLDGNAKIPSLDGSLLRNINGTAITSGTLSYSVLPSTILKDGGNSASTALQVGTASGSNQPVTIVVGASNRMTLATSGYVGIGTSSPSERLTVSGDLAFGSRASVKEDPGDPNRYMLRNRNIDTGIALAVAANGTASSSTFELMGTDFLGNRANYEGLRLTANRNATPPLYQIMTLAGGTGSHRDIQFQVANTDILRLTTNGRVGIGTPSPSYKLDVDGAVNATQLLVNGTDVSASAGAWTVSGQNTYRSSGSVGIGTVSPTQPLHVNGITRLDGDLYVNNDVLTLQASTRNFFNLGGVIRSGAGNAIDLQTNANSTSRVYINTSGNVGVGTTTPTDKLTISGGNTSNVQLTVRDAIQPRLSLFTTYSGAKQWSITNEGNVNRLRFMYADDSADTNAVNAMVMTGTGNVGIGTSSPTNKLDVAGTINASDIKINGISISAASQWSTDGTNVYRSSGNVGIGSTNPADKLDVSGLSGTGNGLFEGARFRDNAFGVHVGGNDLGNYAWIQGRSSTTGTSPLAMNPKGGNVGIGTASPAYTLDVAGPINASSLLLDGTDISNSARAWSVSGGNVFRASGNVGIGVANPVNKLVVNAGTNINLGVTSGINDSSAIKLNAMNDAGGATIPMELVASKFNFIGGNVGIGTNSPSRQLVVNGTSLFGSTSAPELTNLSNLPVKSMYLNDTISNADMGTYGASGATFDFTANVTNANLSTTGISSNLLVPSSTVFSGSTGWNTAARFTAQLEATSAAYGSAPAALLGTASTAYVKNAVFMGSRVIGTYSVGEYDGSGGATGGNPDWHGVFGAQSFAYVGGGTHVNAGGTLSYVSLWNNNSSPTVTNLYGARNWADMSTTGTVTNAYGTWSQLTRSAGTITNAYGLYINDVTGVGTRSYSIYSNGGTSYFAGSVGIGTTTPRSSLDVRGSIISTASTANATTTIDFSQGNIQHTTANCGTFALNNLKDGGSYMFVVKGTTSATCTFTAYSDGGTTALTVHMPPGHGATTGGYHTVYNLAVSGGDVYVAWTPRY